MEALGVLPDFASALKNRGWAKSDSCGIALAGPPAPGGGRVSVLARLLFLWRFSRYGFFPRAIEIRGQFLFNLRPRFLFVARYPVCLHFYEHMYRLPCVALCVLRVKCDNTKQLGLRIA